MIELVSISSDGTQGNAESYAPSISADGRYVTFSSDASNLVEGDTNGVVDIFVHDRVTGETQRVSVSSDGTQGNGNDDYNTSSISADGRYVAFKSSANNLVDVDNGENDTFVHDRVTGQTTMVSVTSDGTQCSSDYVTPAISADGRYVAFASQASNLIEGDTIGGIFMYDRLTGEMTLVSVSSDGMPGNSYSDGPSISSDGRYIAFKSSADNLVEGDTNGVVDCFVYDRLTEKTTRVSVASDGTQPNGVCSSYVWSLIHGPSISADGRYVAFSSTATNLVDVFTEYPDIYIYAGIYVHDRLTGETMLVSVSSDGSQANGGSSLAAISGDGRYVAFVSDATNLVEGVINGYENIYVHDRISGKTTLVSVSINMLGGYNDLWGSSISADGRYIAFASSADNLVEGDTNGASDIFVIDLWASK
jgi:Tol biopolymer transport system component